MYNKEKKYNVPTRVIIGTKCLDDEEYMIPNWSFYDYFDTTPTEVKDSTGCYQQEGEGYIEDDKEREAELKEWLSKKGC